jgi:hypothetical protein
MRFCGSSSTETLLSDYEDKCGAASWKRFIDVVRIFFRLLLLKQIP